MNWKNVKLVWRREIRDQLRDRRTLLVIGVLPLLIYPMMGIVFFRLTQFMQQHDAHVVLVGQQELATASDLPPLVVDDHFARILFHDTSLVERLHVEQIEGDPQSLVDARARLAKGNVDVVVYFPPGFAERMTALRRAIADPEQVTEQATGPPPRPAVFFDSTRDESALAQARIQTLLDRWETQIVRNNLAAGRMPLDMTQPFDIEPHDVSTQESRQAALWSKLLPFIVFVCALTGAFYPAVDLCAGEKERGTLETLLTSPAQRSEIVVGKLLTVITFSIGSALCNLASMAITGQLVIRQLNSMGGMAGGFGLEPPSLMAIGWLVLALVPMAALFSAASLALAALARSTKEGQYYLMPMFLVCMPLMLMPLSPGVELNLSTSLVPITGMVLLMRAAMEGDLWLAATYVAPVGLVTLGCCVLAIRWAIDQFNQESVLFRDTENFSLASWARYAYGHRPATPTFAAALLLVALIFVAQFASQAIGMTLASAADFVKLVLISQLACIVLPVIVMTLVSVRRPLRTFLLDRFPSVGNTLLAVLLAVALLPVGTYFLEWIVQCFPLPDGFTRMAESLAGQPGWELPLAVVLLLMAVLPAFCEEIAFRGFILSGLRSRMPANLAIIGSAILFGLAHATAVQQTISATLLGLVLGYLAVKTENLSPCIAFHMSYNGLHLLRTKFANTLADTPLGGLVFRPTENPVVGVGFTATVVVVGGLAALLLLWQIGRNGRPLAAGVNFSGDFSGGGRSPLPRTAPAEESGA